MSCVLVKQSFHVCSYYSLQLTIVCKCLAQLLHCLLFSSLREEQDGQKVDEEQAVKASVYSGTLQPEQMTHQVDSCLQKNFSEYKAVNHEERNEELSEVFTLQDQLKQAEERAFQVQRQVWNTYRNTVECKSLHLHGFLEVLSILWLFKPPSVFCSQCEGLKGELHELQGLYESSQRERAELEAELQRCRAELDRLAGRKAQVSTRIPVNG